MNHGGTIDFHSPLNYVINSSVSPSCASSHDYYPHNGIQNNKILIDFQQKVKQLNTNDNIERHKRKNRYRNKVNVHVSDSHRSRFLKSLRKTTNNHVDSTTYVTNLSHKHLTMTQYRVLGLGLTFVPSRMTNRESLSESISRFERSNRIKHFFRNQPQREPHPFRPKSTWEPPVASPEIESYLKRVRSTIDNHIPNVSRSNLTHTERKTLNELASDQSLVIKSADKGSGIVVEDRDKYIQAGTNHLSDQTIYEKIQSDPTPQLGLAINTFVKSIHNRGIIDNITKDFLIFPTDTPPRTQQLYFLKKIHKNPISERPIVSGCAGPTEKISKLVDMHLQPFVPAIKSYVKDSGHMINILESTPIPDNCTIATIDVKSLYLNIPHKDGIKAVLNRLYHNNPDSNLVDIPPGTMTDLLSIVLTKNYFQFADQMYHQVQGTAMGTKMAPAYANIFMAELEESLLQNYHTQPVIWKRYIDDIFCIWPGDQDNLKEFIDYINSSHPTIKFTYESSPHTVDFLDLTVYKGDRYHSTGLLDIKPFFKKTNKFQYLHYTSAHPKKTFRSLVKGELTRLLRACSDEDTYNNIVHKLTTVFSDRNYPSRILRDTIQSVPYNCRQDILSQKDKEPSPYDTFLVLPYTKDLDLKTIKSNLKLTETESETVPKPCLSLTKTKNIAKHLVRAKLKDCTDPQQSTDPIRIPLTANLDGHSAGCAIPGCKCCAVMSRKIKIQSSYNHKSYGTAKHSNCSTRNVIYLMECKKCTKGNQYVGQTKRSLSQRLAGHRAAYKVKTRLPIYKHFINSPGHVFGRDIKLSILEKTTPEQLDDRERHWIGALQTVYPKGLNSRYE